MSGGGPLSLRMTPPPFPRISCVLALRVKQQIKALIENKTHLNGLAGESNLRGWPCPALQRGDPPSSLSPAVRGDFRPVSPSEPGLLRRVVVGKSSGGECCGLSFHLLFWNSALKNTVESYAGSPRLTIRLGTVQTYDSVCAQQPVCIYGRRSVT